jgi:Glyoxalase-like domain
MSRTSIALVATICGAATVVSGAQAMSDAVAVVDHLVYAGPDLRVATETIERLLGVKATPGGQHPGRGTRNALIALSPSTYIEIIGPDPEQPTPALPRPFGIDKLSGPKLVTWAAKESDLPRREKSAAANGVKLGALAEGSRQRPDGLLLRWTYTDPRTVVADGLVPFFINWGTTPHPAASAAGGVTLVGLKAQHPDPDRIRQTLGKLGLVMPVSAGASVSLMATIDCPRGRVELH